MLTISKPLSSGHAQAYHKEEFANARDNYYSEGDRVHGEWHGQLARQWGLKGEIDEEHFARLADGQHPLTGAQLVQHRAAMEYLNEHGEKVKTMEPVRGGMRHSPRQRASASPHLLAEMSEYVWRIRRASASP